MATNNGLIVSDGYSIDKKTGPKTGAGEQNDSLRVALEKYNVVTNSTSDAIICKNPEGVIMGWSSGAETLFGYTLAEMLGESIQRLLPTDRLEEEAHIYDQVRRGQEVRPFETVRLRKDGSSIHVSVSISPIPDELGNITAISTIARDITERVRTEKALADLERGLHQLTETLPQIVWVARPDGRNTYLNQRWVESTGMTLAESAGHGWKRPIHPDDRERACDAWQNAVKHHGHFSLECRLRGTDGLYRWWMIRGVPFVGEAGQTDRVQGTCTDIHDLKAAELEIERSGQALADSESQFRGGFEAAAQGMALVSTEGNFLRVNQALCNMLGYAETELLRIRTQDITHPEDLKADLDNMQMLVMGTLKSSHGEKRIFGKSGGIIWIRSIVTVVRSITGAPMHFVAQMQNIEKRSAAKQRLNEARGLTQKESHADLRSHELLKSLSPRQTELMQGMADGQSNKLIARNLGISPRTAEVHRARLMERLRVKSLAEVVRLAIWAQVNMPSAVEGNCSHGFSGVGSIN